MHRERTVGSSMSGRGVSRMKTESDGGSSSVFSSAFCAGAISASAVVDDDHTAAPFERSVRGAFHDVPDLIDS
jgi:hypothetical protein